VLIALWLVRAGSMVRFISKSVLVGFLAGLGIEVLTSQIEKILNISVDTGQWLTDVGEIVTSIPDASAASVVVGVATIVILRLSKRFAPKLPGALIALVVVGGAVYLLEPGGVSLLGEIPSGLPDLSFPTLDIWTWLDLFGVAVAIAVLTIAEGLLVASSAARQHGDELDANGELASMGFANIAAAVTSGMPIGASASRSAATEAAGSRSQMPSLVSALIVALVALFFTDLVAEIPSAALAGWSRTPSCRSSMSAPSARSPRPAQRVRHRAGLHRRGAPARPDRWPRAGEWWPRWSTWCAGSPARRG
jgi:sulfate permease, SulP family